MGYGNCFGSFRLPLSRGDLVNRVKNIGACGRPRRTAGRETAISGGWPKWPMEDAVGSLPKSHDMGFGRSESDTLDLITHMPLSAGDKLGPYEILSAIGAGGMGEVYK